MNLGGCHGNYNIMGVQNSSNVMLFLGFGVHMYLVWTGLIFARANDWYFKGYYYFWCGMTIVG